jgi:hypothetical protein
MLGLTIVLDEPAWPELAATPERIIHVTQGMQVSGLEGGMQSGKPSLALRLDLPDGRVVIAETSLALLVSATRALVARYGDPTQGG